MTTAEAIRVSSDWLDLRERADAAARSRDLVRRLRRRLTAGDPLVIHDLGCGSGAMGRWLAPLLPGPQHWVLHDRDPELLVLAEADATGGCAVTIETRLSDVTRLDGDELADATLITASALLDLLTADELAGLMRACAGAGCPVLLTLSVTGRVQWFSADPLDARVAASFDAHQRRVTRRGRLLGPDAVEAAADGFRRLGAEVIVRPSPWRLGAADTGLAVEWLAGWIDAACEQEPALAADADLYRRPPAERSGSGPLRRHRWPRRPAGAAVRRSLRWARPVVSAAALAVVIWRLGSGPFLDGVRALDGRALLAAAAIFFVTTVCCAWRWKIVARGLGMRLFLPAAVAAYYRCLFLNVTLPSGVAGDVHRGISHGRDVRDVGRALRAVVWERTAGQVIQVVLTVSVLLVLPSPVHSAMPLVAVALVATAVGVLVVDRVQSGRGRSRWERVRNAVVSDIRGGLLTKNALPAIALASTVALLGYAVMFLIAARAAGVTAPISRLLPLTFLAILAMVLPSIGGWGPREGATAWVFSAAGLGADRGAATAVAYGVMVLAASLPGGLVLVAGWLPRQRASRLKRNSFRPEGATDA